MAEDQTPVGKLRRLVAALAEPPDYWTDSTPFWQVTQDFVVTAGDVRAWLAVIDE